MRPETEQRLVSFLDQVKAERERNGDKLGKIHRTVEANSTTLGELAGEVAGVKGELIKQGGRLQRVEDRLSDVENSADQACEATGRHELQRVQDQLEAAQVELDRNREAAKHWRRYVVGVVVGLLIMVGSGLIGWMLKGGSP